jgi:hypothetical protein
MNEIVEYNPATDTMAVKVAAFPAPMAFMGVP